MTLAEAAKALGIPENATLAQAKQAFKKLALKYHPDKVPEAERANAQKLFQKINEAFQVFENHFKNQNTGTGRQNTNTGTHTGTGRQNQSAGNGRPNGGANRPNNSGAHSSHGDPHNDPIIKMYWKIYQRACKDHETFVNGELARSRAKIDTAEQALKSVFGQRNDKELTAVESLAHLLRQHQLLLGRLNLLVKLKEQAMENYNRALAQYEHIKAKRDR